MLHYVIGASTIDGSNDGRFIIESRDVAESHRVTRAKLKPEKILERSRDVLAPIVSRNPRQVHSIDEDPSLVGLVEPGQQLNQRTLAGAVLSDDRNHTPLFQIEAHIFEHLARRAWIREGHMLEADAIDEAVGRGRVLSLLKISSEPEFQRLPEWVSYRCAQVSRDEIQTTSSDPHDRDRKTSDTEIIRRRRRGRRATIGEQESGTNQAARRS